MNMILASWGFIFWVSDLGPFVEFTASGKKIFFYWALKWHGLGGARGARRGGSGPA